MKDLTLTRRELIGMMAAATLGSVVPGNADTADSGESASQNSILALPERAVQVDQGIVQQSNKTLDWILDAKFGMFIHWGLYSGPKQGEWYQHDAGILPDEYRKFAFPVSGDEYFLADQYDPGHWADLAKAAGMGWLCLTARHHDGFSLFDNRHHNAFTSLQTHRRDFIDEYVMAVRSRKLKVGLYFSPIDWRYPGYYDVTGTQCKPNNFGYLTEPSHKESARIWKTENYAAVKKLMTSYGKIDHVFWDGGWISEEGSDADGAFFHEPGEYLHPNNPWQIDKEYLDYDSSGKPLGIMGMVRKYQPNLVCNGRYGWLGDFTDNEGGLPTIGQFDTSKVIEKCITMQNGPWGYSENAETAVGNKGRDEIVLYLVNCVIRNMFLLLNVSPDRHGRIPDEQERILRDTGSWLAKAEEAIFRTRCGPWQPVDRQYGYCYRDNKIFAHILAGYSGTSFTVPPVGPLVPTRVYDVIAKRTLEFDVLPNRTVSINGIDRSVSSIDTIVAIEFDRDVMTYAVGMPDHA